MAVAATSNLLEQADTGSLPALRRLADECLHPAVGPVNRAQAYQYSLMAALLGDEQAALRAGELFGQLPEVIERAVHEEVEDWIVRKMDTAPDDSLGLWSVELLRLRYPIAEVH